MPSQNEGKKFSFEGPAKYIITVQGTLNETWSDRMAGMRITNTGAKHDTPMTTLAGHLRDQAELSGVLNNLYDLHLPIVSVVHVEE